MGLLAQGKTAKRTKQNRITFLRKHLVQSPHYCRFQSNWFLNNYKTLSKRLITKVQNFQSSLRWKRKKIGNGKRNGSVTTHHFNMRVFIKKLQIKTNFSRKNHHSNLSEPITMIWVVLFSYLYKKIFLLTEAGRNRNRMPKALIMVKQSTCLKNGVGSCTHLSLGNIRLGCEWWSRFRIWWPKLPPFGVTASRYGWSKCIQQSSINSVFFHIFPNSRHFLHQAKSFAFAFYLEPQLKNM